MSIATPSPSFWSWLGFLQILLFFVQIAVLYVTIQFLWSKKQEETSSRGKEPQASAETHKSPSNATNTQETSEREGNQSIPSNAHSVTSTFAPDPVPPQTKEHPTPEKYTLTPEATQTESDERTFEKYAPDCDKWLKDSTTVLHCNTVQRTSTTNNRNSELSHKDDHFSDRDPQTSTSAPSIHHIHPEQNPLPIHESKLPPLQEIFSRMQSPTTGLTLKNYTHRLKVYRGCFSGADIVDWVLQNVPECAAQRNKAVEICTKFWAKGLIYSIAPKTPFADGSSLYKFSPSSAVSSTRRSNYKRIPQNKRKKQLQRTETMADMVLRFPTEKQSAVVSRRPEKIEKKEGWLDVREGEVWIKRWCMLVPNAEVEAVVRAGIKSSKVNGRPPLTSSQFFRAHWQELEVESDAGSLKRETTGQTESKILELQRKKRRRPTGWSLVIFDGIVNDAIRSLLCKMCFGEESVQPLKIKTRSYLLKSYKDCFIGKEAVKWCMENGMAQEKATAVQTMNQLLEKGVIRHVTHDHTFKDEKLFYSLDLDESLAKESVLKAKCECLGVVDVTADCAIQLGKDQSGVYYEVTIRGADDEEDEEGNGRFKFRLNQKYDDAILKGWIRALQMGIIADSVGEVASSGLESRPMVTIGEEVREKAENSTHAAVGVGGLSELDVAEYFSDSSSDESDDDEDVEVGKKEDWEEDDTKCSPSLPIVIAEDKRAQRMSEEEREKLEEMKDLLRQQQDATAEYEDFELLKFLRARKLDAALAIILMKNCRMYREKNSLSTLTVDSIIHEIECGLIRITPQGRDRDGRVLLMAFPEFYDPKKTKPMDLARAVTYLLDTVINDPNVDADVQRKGFSVIIDGKQSKFSHFDPKMPGAMLEAVVSKYPARIGYIIIVNAPWFFKFIWAVVRPLVTAHIASKFHIVTVEQLADFVEPQYLLPEHGGTSAYRVEEWIKERRAIDMSKMKEKQ